MSSCNCNGLADFKKRETFLPGLLIKNMMYIFYKRLSVLNSMRLGGEKRGVQ